MKIFISYRRAETPHQAHRIRQQLQHQFGADSVFIDRKIPPGQEFDKFLETELKSCDALVAVMGNDFFRTKKKRNAALPEEVDYVRWEIETALQMAIPVFPIIVGKDEMPREKDLPEGLKAYAKKQALYAVEPAFDSAIDELVKALKTSGIVLRQDDRFSGSESDSSKTAQTDKPSVPSAAFKLDPTISRGLSVGMLVLLFLGWLIDQATRGVPSNIDSIPRYFIVGLVFSTTTVSITFCPLWFYKLVNVVRARLYLNVGSIKAVIVTCSATSVWITNTVFLSLATNPNFEYSFLGIKLPIWAYIVLGLMGTLWLALLAMWEVGLNKKQNRSLGLSFVFVSHILNCFIQIALLALILRYVAGGEAHILNGLLLYLTACLCGTVTFAVSWGWRSFFSSNGYWSLSFLTGSLFAAWFFLTASAYTHALAKLVL